MAVYVDDMYRSPVGRFGHMKMSHMAADTEQELLAMANRIGVEARHIQRDALGRRRPHFDVSKSKRALAVRHGAREVTQREMVKIVLLI